MQHCYLRGKKINMKILHLVHNYFPSPGGPQYTIKNLSEKLVQYYGDEVTVATSNSMYSPHAENYQKISPQVEVINDVKVYRLPFRRWHFGLIKFCGKVYGKLTGKALPIGIRKLRYGFDSPALIKYLKTSDADVVMGTTSINNFVEYPLWRFKTKTPKPFVLYGAIHIHNDGDIGETELEKIKACDCYIANTQYEKDQLINSGIDGNKIKVIGTGIDTRFFLSDEKKLSEFKSDNAIAESDIVIGYVGSIKSGKGVNILIEAFIQLYKLNKNLKLLICGTFTSYAHELKNLANVKKLPIIIIDNFSESRKGIYFNAIDIFVLPSASESFGVVFLEAWACKKPVVGSSIGAVKSLIEEDVDGLIFEKKSVESLYQKLFQLVNDKALRNRLGENGYTKAKQKYNWPVIVKQYREAYLFAIDKFNMEFKNQLSS